MGPGGNRDRGVVIRGGVSIFVGSGRGREGTVMSCSSCGQGRGEDSGCITLVLPGFQALGGA